MGVLVLIAFEVAPLYSASNFYARQNVSFDALIRQKVCLADLVQLGRDPEPWDTFSR